MSNLTRYRIVAPDDYGAEEHPNGEYVKFDDIKELLNTAHNNARDAIDECRGCLYDGQCVYPRPCVVNGKSCRSTAPVA